MKRLIVFLIVFLFLASFVSACAQTPSETPTQETPAPTSDPSFYLDSDGDGMNDWFEINIAHYDPDVPNDRYVVFFEGILESETEAGVDTNIIVPVYNFFTEKAKIPPENVIMLKVESNPEKRNTSIDLKKQFIK